MSSKVAFLVPTYPPHFQFAKEFLKSFYSQKLDAQADVWFVFTNEEERIAFGGYKHSIVLSEELRVFENKGIINIKKFYGLRQIQDKYSYVIVLDSESRLLKNVNLFDICEEYFSSKILIGNEIFLGTKERTEGIKNSCRAFFVEHKDFEKLNNPLYLWFNQPCIYSCDTLDDFWNKIDYDKNIKNLKFDDFDYYIYMFYLILYHEFQIDDIEIKSSYGICECPLKILEFKSKKYKKLSILITSSELLKKVNNPKCFLSVQLDKSNNWKSANPFSLKLANFIAKLLTFFIPNKTTRKSLRQKIISKLTQK